MVNSNKDPKVIELLTSESRYFKNANIVDYEGNQMYDIPYRSSVSNSTNDEYFVTTSKYQNRYDRVSQDNYDNSKLWWVLADINKIDNPFVLDLDEVVRIPSLGKLILDEVI